MPYNILAYFVGLNAFVYLAIHVPLDIFTLLNKEQKEKDGTKEYSRWENNALVEILTILSTLYFWAFFLCWPVVHIMFDMELSLLWHITLPYSEAMQYLGMVLISAGTFIACAGRIARGQNAISWGVPKELTTRWGFRVVRHPLYASYCYYFIGIPLTMQTPLLFPLILGVIGYYLTAQYEETILETEFGEQYRRYQQEVGMLIPFVGRK